MMEKSWKENKWFIVFQSIVKRFDYLVIILHYFPLCWAMQDSLKLAIKPDLIEKIWIQEQIMYHEEISLSGWRWGRLLHFCAETMLMQNFGGQTKSIMVFFEVAYFQTVYYT